MRRRRYWLAILAVVVAVSIVVSSWISPYPGIAAQGEDYTAEIQRNRTTLSGGELATVEKITQTAFAQPITKKLGLKPRASSTAFLINRKIIRVSLW